MDTAIVYYSKYGHTKKYAEMLQKRLLCDIYEVDDFNAKLAKKYKNIFYGSSIRANKILKISKFFKEIKDEKNFNIFIFADGLSTIQYDDLLREMVIAYSDLSDKHVRLFLLPGGFSFDLLHKKDKLIFSIIKKTTTKDKNSAGNINLLMKGIDLVKEENLNYMIDRFYKTKI